MYPRPAEPAGIPLWRRILARLGIPTILYWEREGFARPAPIFIAFCRRHGAYFLDYPRPPNGDLLCPLCHRLLELVLGEGAKKTPP